MRNIKVSGPGCIKYDALLPSAIALIKDETPLDGLCAPQ